MSFVSYSVSLRHEHTGEQSHVTFRGSGTVIYCDSVICELIVCVAGVRVGRSVRLQPGLGRDPLSEGHPERRIQLPGGV